MPTGKPRKLIIAIDGPAGSGKSTTAKALAKKLQLPYIDTGAMYRAATLEAVREGADFSDKERLAEITKNIKIDFDNQKVFLDGEDVTRQIREHELTKKVVYVARERLIRREMVKKQRALAETRGAVMEGRDIGTVVFPGADYKFYFEAAGRVRARRRQRDLAKEGSRMPLGQVLKDIKKRDRTDSIRKEGPLRRAKDAILIDTTSLTISQTVDRILAIVRSKPLKSRPLGKSV